VPGAWAASRRSPRDGPLAARAAVKRKLSFRRPCAPYTRGRCRPQLRWAAGPAWRPAPEAEGPPPRG
jgi:hypothetical protein